VAATAQVYTQPIVLASPALLRARVRSDSTWSAMNQAQFYPPQDFSKLQLSELMYNPPKFGSVDGEEFEFLELKNTGAAPLELTGLRFTRGITFVFTNGTTLESGQYFVLARNAAQYEARYPGAPWHGIYSGKLDNNGETVELSTALGTIIFSVTYNNAAPWPAEADNSGLSLQRIHFASSPTNAQTWLAASPTPGNAAPADLLDNDGDGMPDAWERLHALTDPNEDPDGDGLTNYQEFLAGTEPHDEDDALRVASLEKTSRPGSIGVVLSFSARSNKTYSITRRDLPGSNSWSSLLHITAQPTNRFVRVTNIVEATAAGAFFRLTTPRVP
jgi:hypothetical protein